MSSPLGMAAGFDKDAKLVGALSALGFGFIEVGTVTPEPQAGNPRPRLFRLPYSRALVNRLGFNSEGADAVVARLQRLHSKREILCPIGINIGKNRLTPLDLAAQDYALGVKKLYALADFFVVNVSSPNTPGLRNLLDESYLRPLLQKIRQARDEMAKLNSGRMRDLLLKISPDMEVGDRKKAVDLALQEGFSGIVATNTTIRRDLVGIDILDQESAKEEGGLSGLPLRDLAVPQIAELRAWMGKGPLLISVGGLRDVEDARERLDLGADLLEVYTQFIYEGPKFPQKIAGDLASRFLLDL